MLCWNSWLLSVSPQKPIVMYAEKRALYDQIVALAPEIERLGKTMPYTAANTHIHYHLGQIVLLKKILRGKDG